MIGPLTRPTIGRPAPDIELVDEAGAAWRLHDQRGQSVVLVFHRHIH